MRYYVIIWLGIAACFAFMQADHALPAVISLMASWLVALFFKPAPTRVRGFSPVIDTTPPPRAVADTPAGQV